MANFRGGLYTAARAMGDLNAAMKVKQRGGHTMRRLLDQKNLSGITEITVGYLTNKRYPDGTMVRYVAIQNEFGTPKIPERPFMRRSSKAMQRSGQSGSILTATTDFTRGSLVNRNAARSIAQALIDTIRDNIKTSKSWATPNAPFTIEVKGFDWPLVETDLLMNSMTWRTKTGLYPNPDYSPSSGKPFNLRSLLYGAAKMIGDYQAIANGSVVERAGNRVYGKFSGRAIGSATPATRGVGGRGARKVVGKGAGHLKGLGQ